MMIPPPVASLDYWPGLFRLAGYGGALVILRSGVDQRGLTLDVGFLSPTDYVWFLRKPVTAGFADRLATLFFDCANELAPELVVAPFVDEGSGLQVRVLSSGDSRVELQFDLADEGLNFETSRVALVQAASEIRVLERVRPEVW